MSNTNFLPPLDAQNPVSDRFQIWRGKSGRRYVHSVFATDNCPDLENAIYVAVSRDGGSRRALAIDGAEAFMTDGDKRPNGAWPGGGRVDEVHVHLLASTRRSIEKVIADLRAEHGLACDRGADLPDA